MTPTAAPLGLKFSLGRADQGLTPLAIDCRPVGAKPPLPLAPAARNNSRTLYFSPSRIRITPTSPALSPRAGISLPIGRAATYLNGSGASAQPRTTGFCDS